MSRALVLFTQPIVPAAMDRIAAVADICVAKDRSETGLKAEIADAAVLVVRDPITPPVIAAGKMLRLIARHGVGTDYIPVDECTRLGIPVTITPDTNTNAVAEWVIGAILSLAHRFAAATGNVRKGDWKTRDGLEGFELQGRTLGIVGFGRIGSRVSAIASGAFGMQVIAFDPARDDESISRYGAERTTLEELLARSDVVTLHLPLTPDTRHLVNAHRIGTMKRGALLINSARGALVETAALLAALESGRLGGAALDGLDQEPPAPEHHAITGMANVILTPHSAALTEEALSKMGHSVADAVLDVLAGKKPSYIVNCRTEHGRS